MYYFKVKSSHHRFGNGNLTVHSENTDGSKRRITEWKKVLTGFCVLKRNLYRSDIIHLTTERTIENI